MRTSCTRSCAGDWPYRGLARADFAAVVAMRGASAPGAAGAAR